MEEQRISMMYVNMVKRAFTGTWDRLFGSGLRRSPVLPWLVVLLVALPFVGWSLHMHGKFATLKRSVRGESQSTPANTPRPGGAAPVLLSRQQTQGSDMPEFLSATVLPGLGMNVLQLTAYIPGRGEVQLLAAPSVQQMADANQEAVLEQAHGAIQLPWSGLLAGLAPPTGGTLNVSWHNRTYELPAVAGFSRDVTSGGLLALESLQATKQEQSEAEAVSGVITGTDFGGRWPSQTDVHADAQITARSFDLRVVARNAGAEPEPLGIGWQPEFQIVSGDRAQVQVHLPGGEQLQTGEGQGALPTGKVVEPAASIGRLQNRSEPLGREPVGAALVHLKASVVDARPMAEFRDPAAGYGMRMIAISPNTRELRLRSPLAAHSLSLGMQTNLDDPLGKQWGAEAGGGIAILQPGQSIEWRVRLEIFRVSPSEAAAH